MSRFLLVCARNGVALPLDRIRRACALVAPDHLRPAPPAIARAAGLHLVVLGSPGAGRAVALRGTSACLGAMLDPGEGWWLPGGPPPDGAYALVRSDASAVELVADAVASRSIYCALDEDLFVASSSQRAIAAVRGRFRLDPVAVSWMLSAGALGPRRSWDASVSRLGPDERATLDRRSWTLASERRPVLFDPRPGSRRAHQARLAEAVTSSCKALQLEADAFSLPLSGGYDSRCLALLLARRRGLACITWGLRASLDDAASDAAVARALAARLGVPHRFHALDGGAEPVEVLFERFLTNGDGAVDHIAGYMDGFEVWRQLAEAGVAGVVRGDEGFGWEPVLVAGAVRPGVGALRLDDVFPEQQLARWGLAAQAWPAELERAPGETLATWRDRLYHAFRIPTVLASLTDLKTPYVEVVCPLLARRILEVVRSLPDPLRTGKRLFKDWVRAASPPVPFATRNAIADPRALVAGPAFLALTRGEVAAGAERGSLPAPFAEALLAALPAPAGAPPSARAALLGWARRQGIEAARAVVPVLARNTARALLHPPPSPRTLAFRAAIASRMAQRLEEAARGTPEPRGRPRDAGRRAVEA